MIFERSKGKGANVSSYQKLVKHSIISTPIFYFQIYISKNHLSIAHTRLIEGG